MKVLHVLQSGSYSGAENVVFQIIDILKENKSIEMLYCSRDGQIRNYLIERQIPFFPVTNCSVKEIKRVIKAVKPDIIHAHDMRASYCVSRACGSIPYISHIHNNAFDSRGISLKSIAYYFAAIKAKHIFWVSRSSFDGYAFHNALKDKSSVLFNVIDIDSLITKKEMDSNEYNYDLVYVGRITYQKNPERLINICKLLCERNKGIKIAIIGKGDLEQKTRELVSNYHIEDNVDFLGFLNNPIKILSQSKVMIMTSRWEGTPMSALEAMAVGVPIVSTPVDGLKDLIENDITGYLSNSDEEITAKILEIIENPDIRSTLSKNIIDKAYAINNKERYKECILNEYKKCNV